MIKDGFEAIWRPESRYLDIYELDKTSAPYFLRAKRFTNARVAESYFMDKVGKRPSDGLHSPEDSESIMDAVVRLRKTAEEFSK